MPFTSEKRDKVLKDFSPTFLEDHGIKNRITVEPENSQESGRGFINSRDRGSIA